MINAAIIGYGYWGPNIVRNFHAHPEIQVLKICDISNKQLNVAMGTHPDIDTTMDPNNIFSDKDIDLIAI